MKSKFVRVLCVLICSEKNRIHFAHLTMQAQHHQSKQKSSLAPQTQWKCMERRKNEEKKNKCFCQSAQSVGYSYGLYGLRQLHKCIHTRYTQTHANPRLHGNTHTHRERATNIDNFLTVKTHRHVCLLACIVHTCVYLDGFHDMRACVCMSVVVARWWLAFVWVHTRCVWVYACMFGWTQCVYKTHTQHTRQQQATGGKRHFNHDFISCSCCCCFFFSNIHTSRCFMRSR